MRPHSRRGGCTPEDPTHPDQGLPGRSDVICGIRATGGRVHPQAMRKIIHNSSRPLTFVMRTNRNRIRIPPNSLIFESEGTWRARCNPLFGPANMTGADWTKRRGSLLATPPPPIIRLLKRG